MENNKLILIKDFLLQKIEESRNLLLDAILSAFNKRHEDIILCDESEKPHRIFDENNHNEEFVHYVKIERIKDELDFSYFYVHYYITTSCNQSEVYKNSLDMFSFDEIVDIINSIKK